MNRFVEFIKMVHREEGGFFGIDIAIGTAITAAMTAIANAVAGASAAVGLGTTAAAATTAIGTGAPVAGATFGTGLGVAVPGTGLAGAIQGAAAGLAAPGMAATIGQGVITAGVGVVGSAATSIYSGYAQAREMKAMGKAQQRFAEYNASIADSQATGERQAGAASLRDARVRGEQIRERHRYLKGAQQAKLAKSGVVASAGTPLLVASEEAMRGKLDVLDEIWKGKMQKREHDIRAGYYESQAAGQRMEGAFAKKSAGEKARSSILSGYISAGSSLLGGVGQYYDMYNKYKGNNKMLSDQFTG
jgi:hypothetical protein